MTTVSIELYTWHGVVGMAAKTEGARGRGRAWGEAWGACRVRAWVGGGGGRRPAAHLGEEHHRGEDAEGAKLKGRLDRSAQPEGVHGRPVRAPRLFRRRHILPSTAILATTPSDLRPISPSPPRLSPPDLPRPSTASLGAARGELLRQSTPPRCSGGAPGCVGAARAFRRSREAVRLCLERDGRSVSTCGTRRRHRQQSDQPHRPDEGRHLSAGEELVVWKRWPRRAVEGTPGPQTARAALRGRQARPEPREPPGGPMGRGRQAGQATRPTSRATAPKRQRTTPSPSHAASRAAAASTPLHFATRSPHAAAKEGSKKRERFAGLLVASGRLLIFGAA